MNRFKSTRSLGPGLMSECHLTKLDQIKKLLDHAGFRYSVAKYALSSDGEPYIVKVGFEHRAEVAALQAVFDDEQNCQARLPDG